MKKRTIEDMQRIAKEIGGKCLSAVYINNKVKLNWQCKSGHRFEITPTKIKHKGQWCPICRPYLINEKICRVFFERIFQKKFPKTKPNWLITPSGTRLELDGYCADKDVAFEYQGAQHYRYVKMFHRTFRDLDKQKEADKIKRELCLKNNVYLIEIPYTIPYDQLGIYIYTECMNKRLNIPTSIDLGDFRDFDINNPNLIKEMQSIAKEKGGLCLSKNYVDNLTSLKFKCHKGHTWKTTPKMIKKGNWCHYCVGNVRKSFDDVQKTVQLKKGKILEGNYVNNRSKFLIKCEKDHIFSTNYHELASGGWCLRCSGLFPLTIEEMQQIAAEREGLCLSEKYINAQTPLEWQCSKGHKWLARPTSIKQGGWCPFCSKRVKLTIEEMRDLAKQKDGFCLSDKYVNNKTKLLWKCKQGHEWWQKPEHIKNGHWCPKRKH